MTTMERSFTPALKSTYRRRRHGRVGDRKPLLLGIAVLLYVVVIHAVYATVIAPRFAYLGLRYRDPQDLFYVLAVLVLMGTTLLLPRTLERVSDFIIWVMHVLLFAPTMLIPAYSDILTPGGSFRLALVTGLVAVGLVHLRRLLPAPVALHAGRISDLSTGILLTLWLVMSFLTVQLGPAPQLATLTEVRDVRMGFRDQIAASGPLLGYSVRFLGNVLNPLFMIKGTLERKPWLLVLGIGCQIYVYAITGFKLTVLAIPATIVLAFALQRIRKLSGLSVMLFAVTVMALSWLFDSLTGVVYWSEILTDRLIIWPGALSAAHFLVFADLPKIWWSNSVMSPFIQYPYQIDAAFIVGRVFQNQDGVAANAGILADGYMNGGLLGIAIETLALVFLLYLLDCVTQHLPRKLVFALALVPAIATANSGVFTAVLTNGFGLMALVCALLPAGTGERRQGRQR